MPVLKKSSPQVVLVVSISSYVSYIISVQLQIRHRTYWEWVISDIPKRLYIFIRNAVTLLLIYCPKQQLERCKMFSICQIASLTYCKTLPTNVARAALPPKQIHFFPLWGSHYFVSFVIEAQIKVLNQGKE